MIVSHSSICVELTAFNSATCQRTEANGKQSNRHFEDAQASSGSSDSQEELYTSDDETSEDDDEAEPEEPDIMFAVEAILRLNIGPALELHRDRLYELLRENLKYVLPQTDSSMSSHAGGEQPVGSKGYSGSGSSLPKKQRTNGSTACQSNSVDKGEVEDNEEDDGGHEEVGNPDIRQGTTKTPRLACPFYKNDPAKYQDWRGCPGPGWDAISRLKYGCSWRLWSFAHIIGWLLTPTRGHLYRNHKKPYQCLRCWSSFQNTEEISRHHSSEEPCERREEIVLDGLDQLQIDAIRSKKRPRGLTHDCEKWTMIYKIIFPNANTVPSPCKPSCGCS